jgi:hypothetical protein
MVLAEGTLDWSISAPRFEVAVTGIRFKALLQARFSAGGVAYRSIDIAASISYDNNAIRLTIAPDLIPVQGYGFFGALTLTSISPGAYYSTRLNTAPASFSFALPDGNRTVVAAISSMQIVYENKQIVLKPSFSID